MMSEVHCAAVPSHAHEEDLGVAFPPRVAMPTRTILGGVVLTALDVDFISESLLLAVVCRQPVVLLGRAML